MRLLIIVLVLCRNAAGSPFFTGTVKLCTGNGCSSSTCSPEQEITDSCTRISNVGSASLTCNLISNDWTMKLCLGGSDCSSGICATASQSGSASCAEVIPGQAYARVSCQLSVLSICLIGLLVVLLLVCCCRLVCSCCDAACDMADEAEAAGLIDRAKRDQLAASRERQPLLSARRDAELQRLTELRLLTTKEELALAQLRITRLGAELEEERRGRAASPPAHEGAAFPPAPALRWAKPHAWPEDARGKGAGER